MNLQRTYTEDAKNKVMNLSQVKDVQLHLSVTFNHKAGVNERKAAIYLKTIEGDLHPN